MRRAIPAIAAALLIAAAYSQDKDAAKTELIAASDAKSPKSLAELSKENSDAVKLFTTAEMGAGFTAEQKAYVSGLYLDTDAATIERLNAASPRNFRLPTGLVTIAGEVLLPFDLVTDANNYSWCRSELLSMKVLRRAAKDFPAPKPIDPAPKVIKTDGPKVNGLLTPWWHR